MPKLLSPRPGRLSVVPYFSIWMVGMRLVIDLFASSLGQAWGLVLWLGTREGTAIRFPAEGVKIFLVGEVMGLLAFVFFDLYSPHRSLLDLREHRQLLRAWLMALAGTRLLLYFMQVPVSSVLLLCVWASLLPSLYFGRHFYHWMGEQLRRAGFGGTSALVYGAGETGIRLVRELQRQPELGIQVVGFVDDGLGARSVQGPVVVGGIPVLGDYSHLDALLAPGVIRHLYIALPQVPRRTVLDILAVCRRHGVVFQIVPSVTDQILALVELQDIDGVPLLGPPSLVMPAGPRLRKRILDLSLAIPLLLLAGPLLLVLLPWVRRSTGGSALVRIPVVGEGGRPFRLLRLRTMPAKVRPELHRVVGDARLTLLGRALRASMLEIAPELWNVLQGTLSMVGPRPLGLREAAQLDPQHKFRLSLPPGLTGLWKVDSRPGIGPLDELELDLLYLRQRSFLLDITVLLRSLDEFVRSRPVSDSAPGSDSRA